MQMKALAQGADAVYTARGFLFAIGCIHALQCNTDLCPAGITTHNRALQRGLDIAEKSLRVADYAHNLEHMLYELLAATGRKSFEHLSPEALLSL
jgi:glutamate synthase domain-containing protein 2